METQSLRKIVFEHQGKEIRDISRIHNKGEVNDIYVLTTDLLKYVLRVDPNESSPVRFQKEAWCMGAADKAGVPVPKPLRVGMEGTRPYMLMSYCAGTRGEDADTESKDIIWGNLGEYARKLHSIKVTGFGETMDAPGHFSGSWTEYLDYNISSLNNEDELLALGIITREQSEALKEIFLHLKNTKLNFGLVHNDLSLKNTILGSDGAVYLLDWGSAGAYAVPHMDLAEVLQFSLKENWPEFRLFLNGYGMGRDEFEKLKPDVWRLQLLTLIDKVRWAIDKQPSSIEQKAEGLLGAIADYSRSLN